MKKVNSTAILLLITLLVVPVITYFFGTSLSPLQCEALKTVGIIAFAAIAFSFIVGEITKNNSQTDKLWSIVPIIYVWVVAGYGNFSPRLVLMAVLVSLWGIRLTANFALKGAYQWRFWTGEEDYRWEYLRSRPEFNSPWKWTVFNLLFICIYQHSLILLFTLPSLIALHYANTPLNAFDFIIAFAMVGFILYEMIADIQHWKFQSKKWAKINANEELTGEYKKGFLDKGLWAYSRHPNYFGEQAVWICFYLFSISAGGYWLNWTIAGSLLLVVLFQVSSTLAEGISSSKYPLYKTYQIQVPSKFFPLPRKQQ